jgi:hypothetical protein
MGPLKGDSVKSKPSKTGKYQETDSDTSDSEYAPPSKGKASVNRKTKLKKTVKRFNSIESSDSEDSSSDKFDEPKTPLWRNNRDTRFLLLEDVCWRIFQFRCFSKRLRSFRTSQGCQERP